MSGSMAASFNGWVGRTRGDRVQNPMSEYNNLRERFEAKVIKGDGCWIWTGSKGPNGHGFIASGGYGKTRLVRAGAVALWIAHGQWPGDGLDVCHKCDNPPCVNPDHLFVGTAKDNMQDSINKGRFKFPKPRPGEANNKARLTWALVETIRTAYNSGENLSDLSRRFGFARSTLREVVNGRNWRRPDVPIRPRFLPTKRLEPHQIQEIRRLYRSGRTQVELAELFGVSQGYVSHVVRAA